jgi:acyl-CoA thioester hydrolase
MGSREPEAGSRDIDTSASAPAPRLPAPHWADGWFTVPWQVIFRDVDAFGHVNNAVYLSYFEWARAQLWFALTGGGLPSDIGFIVARAEVDFILQLGMEPIDICVRVGEMRNTSFETLYEIRKGDGEQVAAKGRVVVVLFDWKKQSKTPITDELRRKVRLLQQGAE